MSLFIIFLCWLLCFTRISWIEKWQKHIFLEIWFEDYFVCNFYNKFWHEGYWGISVMVESVISWSSKIPIQTQLHIYNADTNTNKTNKLNPNCYRWESCMTESMYFKQNQQATVKKQITYKQNQTKKQNKLKIKIQNKTEKVVSRPRPQAGSYHRHNTSQFQPSIHLTEKILGGCNITSRN